MEELENTRHELFCLEYMKTLNATRAYMIVYPASSKKAAEVSASHLISKPKIKERIAKLKEKRAEMVSIDAQDVLKCFLEIRDTCKAKMAVRDDNGEIMGFRVSDAVNALKANENIAKHIGFYEKDNTSKLGIEDILRKLHEEKND